MLWEPPLEDVPGLTTRTPMLIFIILGGGGVGARLYPLAGIKHSAVISGVRGGTTVRHDNDRSSLHALV
eukprot:394438-Rhodomonas_salina.1